MTNDNKWTHFWDMHSGGNLKEGNFHHIYIEASMHEAKVIFYNRFGHNPDRVSCTCCGEDYSVSEEESLSMATAYQRGVYRYVDASKRYITGRYIDLEEESIPKGYVKDKFSSDRDYIPLKQYINREDVLVIYKEDIKDSEHSGEIPEQGYIWVD